MDISQKIQKLYEQTGISPEVYDFGEKIEKSLKERFDKIDKMAELNHSCHAGGKGECRML